VAGSDEEKRDSLRERGGGGGRERERGREREKERAGGERAIVTGIKRSDFSSELSLRCFLFAPSLFPCLLSQKRNCLINYDG